MNVITRILTDEIIAVGNYTHIPDRKIFRQTDPHKQSVSDKGLQIYPNETYPATLTRPVAIVGSETDLFVINRLLRHKYLYTDADGFVENEDYVEPMNEKQEIAKLIEEVITLKGQMATAISEIQALKIRVTNLE